MEQEYPRIPLNEGMAIKRCNCESSYCDHTAKNEMCNSPQAEGKRVIYIGGVCTHCFNMYQITMN
jgi:hypothetical protein